jgi:protein-S-isoprenylcysteine O-methyltransferase Ste14
MSTKRPAIIIVPLIIGLLASVFCILGYYTGEALGLPSRLHLPTFIRVSGGIAVAFGLIFLGWLLRYRKPREILVSTYATMREVVRRRPLRDALRAEPLILQGPQRHVRHPLYFAVVVLLVGWWLVLDYTFLLFMALFFFLWFNLVVIRFEEHELRALFGEQYEAYAKSVPRFFPSLKSRWP